MGKSIHKIDWATYWQQYTEATTRAHEAIAKGDAYERSSRLAFRVTRFVHDRLTALAGLRGVAVADLVNELVMSGLLAQEAQVLGNAEADSKGRNADNGRQSHRSNDPRQMPLPNSSS